MADPTQPKQQKIDPTRVKIFWPGPINTAFTILTFWHLSNFLIKGLNKNVQGLNLRPIDLLFMSKFPWLLIHGDPYSK